MNCYCYIPVNSSKWCWVWNELLVQHSCELFQMMQLFIWNANGCKGSVWQSQHQDREAVLFKGERTNYKAAWSLLLSKRVLKLIWISYWAPSRRRRFNQNSFFCSSCVSAFCTRNCFLTCIENCSLDFLSMWGDRSTVYKDRDSGNPTFCAYGITPSTLLAWLIKDFITMRILAAMAPQLRNFCHWLQMPFTPGDCKR